MNIESWRLVLDEPFCGAQNMARDEAIWHAVSRGQAPPTLRFYSWNPSCLSLGRLQRELPASVRELEEGKRADFEIVRRPTGGRAVWHASEITYSLAVPLAILPQNSRGVNAAYEFLSRGFLCGLREAGLPVELSPQDGKARGPNCFEASAACDFVANGKKLIGAAQCRNEAAILQHGSILLSIQSEKWQQFAGGAMDGAISLSQIGAQKSDANEWRAVLIGGFEREFDLRFERHALSSREKSQSLELEAKYRSTQWNFVGQWP